MPRKKCEYCAGEGAVKIHDFFQPCTRCKDGWVPGHKEFVYRADYEARNREEASTPPQQHVDDSAKDDPDPTAIVSFWFYGVGITLLLIAVGWLWYFWTQANVWGVIGILGAMVVGAVCWVGVLGVVASYIEKRRR